MCRVIDIREATEEVLLLRLTPVGGSVPYSKPGQYLEAVLPGGERIPLSVANRPNESAAWIELHLHRGPDKRRIGMLLEALRSDGVVAVEMPKGDVWVEAPLVAPLLMLAAGTGIAQSKAVIEAVMASPMPSVHPLSLIWISRSADDFYLRDELQAWRLAEPEFEFTLFSSDGRELREMHAAVNAERNRIEAKDILVSGSPAFVADCLSYFDTIGAAECRVRSDMFCRPLVEEKRGPIAVAI